jgi:DNA-binding response OmpR family regulator
MSDTARILLVDDDRELRDLVSRLLERHGYQVFSAKDSREMAAVLGRAKPDLLILDVMLPGKDGLQICREVRGESHVPILMLTAMGDEADRVIGLEMGADDYLAKPFSPRELLARIRTILRRRRAEVRQGRPEGIRAFRFDGWELNLNTRRLAAPDGRQVALSNGEFSLLVVLLGSPQRILTRDQLIDLSRLHNDEVYNRSVDVQIMRLRRKIEKDPAEPRYIRTERGAGYLFGMPVETVY